MPTEASTTLSRSFAPVFAPDVTATTSGTQSGAPTASDTDGAKAEKKGVPKWVPIVCGVAGGIVGLVMVLLLWRYWRRRAKFERGRMYGGEFGDGRQGQGPTTWRKDGEKAVWPNAAVQGSQQDEEARRNNPYLQQSNRRRGSMDSGSSASTRSSRSSRSESESSESASEAEIVTRSGQALDGPKTSGPRQGHLQPGKGVASTSPRASYDYDDARPHSQSSSHGHWGSVYPSGSKAVPMNVGVMRQVDTGHASDSSGGRGKIGAGAAERDREIDGRRNAGSTYLHPRKAPRPGQRPSESRRNKSKKERRGEEWLSYTEDDYSEDDEDGRTTDETADVSLKSPVGPVSTTQPKQVAFDVPAMTASGQQGVQHQESLSPRSLPHTTPPSGVYKDKAASPPFAKSPLEYSSASSHAGSPRAQRNIGQGERSSRLAIANAHPGDVSAYSSPDTAAPPALMPSAAERRASGNGPSPLRQGAVPGATTNETAMSPGAAAGVTIKGKEKSPWNRLKDKTKGKVKERTGRRNGAGEAIEEKKGKKDRKERKERGKTGKIKKSKDGKVAAVNSRSQNTAPLSPNPAGLPVLSKRSDNDNAKVAVGVSNSRDSLQTLIRYHSPEPISSIPPDASTATALSPTSVYTHRTSHHAPLSMHPFAADLHTREPLPAFVTQPLPHPPGSKRTSPLRPRKSFNSSMRGTPRASIMGTQAGWAQVLGGRGSPSRMSASAAAAGHGSGDARGQGVKIGNVAGRSRSPGEMGAGWSEGHAGLGRSHGYPGSIDFSLPPATPTRLPPLPDLPAQPHVIQHQGSRAVTQGRSAPAAETDMAYRGHSEYSAHPAAPSSDAHGAPLPASLPSTKESHQMGDAYEAVDKSALHFAIARTGMAFDSDVEEQLSAGVGDVYGTPGTGMGTSSALTPVPRDTFGAGDTPRVAVGGSAKSAIAADAGKEFGTAARSKTGQEQRRGPRGMPRDSEYRAAAYRSTQGRQGERSSLAPTLPSLYEPKSAAPRWEAGESMPCTPVKDKLDRMNRI